MAGEDKSIVLITGANGGLGYATVVTLAKSQTRRYHIILCSRSPDKGQKALDEISRHLAQLETKVQTTISMQQLDVTDSESIASAKEAVERDFGRLDILVNNAGIWYNPARYKGTSSEGSTLISELRMTFETNTFGPTLVTEAFLPLLKKSSHARIVYVSSDLGSIGKLVETRFLLPSISYRMSKAALDMLAVYHNLKYEAEGIKVTVYNPGFTVTDLGNPGMDPAAWAEFRKKNGARDVEESAAGLVDVIRGQKGNELLKGVEDVDGRVLPW